MSRHRRLPGRPGTASRLVAACMVVGGSLGFVPLAHADSELTLTPIVEAWYQPNATCVTPAGCQAPPAAPPDNSPFPAGTLHVGLSAGQETARSYLALPFSGALGTITSGSLSVPLDTSATDGSSNPTSAKVQVCLTSATFTAVEGSFEPPPKVDCSTAAPAAYVDKPQPHLQADLGSLASALSTATGLVLLPDKTKAAPSDSWRIVFSAHTRTDAAKTPPAMATVSVAEPPATSPDQQPVVSLPDNNTSGLGGITPPTGTGFAAGPSAGDLPAVGAPAVTAPVVTAPAGSAPGPAGRTVTVGYAYPVVWLLPLALLLLVPLVARALTRDLMPATASRG